MPRLLSEIFVIRSQHKICHKFAAVIPAFELCHDRADRLPEQKQRKRGVSCSHEDRAVQTFSIFRQILPYKKRTHTVPQNKIREIRIRLLNGLPNLMYVLDQAPVPILFMEKPKLFLRPDGSAMPQMIMTHNIKSFCRHILRKRLISPDIFCHSMTELENRAHLVVRHP